MNRRTAIGVSGERLEAALNHVASLFPGSARISGEPSHLRFADGTKHRVAVIADAGASMTFRLRLTENTTGDLNITGHKLQSIFAVDGTRVYTGNAGAIHRFVEGKYASDRIANAKAATQGAYYARVKFYELLRAGLFEGHSKIAKSLW